MNKGIWTAVVAVGLSLGVASIAPAEEITVKAPTVPPVVAKVNGKEIKAADYEQVYQQIEMDRGGQGKAGNSQAQEAIKKEALDRLVVLELLSQKVDQMRIQVDPKEVDEHVQSIEKRIGGKDALDKALKGRGLTRDAYVADVRKSLRIQSLIQKEVLDKVAIDANEVKAFYEGNPKAFEVPEQVRARHIIIRVQEGATEAQKKEARAAIEKAAERIRKGESFEAVAKEVSQDGAAAKGGDLGYFSRGQMVPEFEKVAFSLEKGKVSGVVETQFGYHLIKVEDKKPAHTITLDEAKPKIEAFLKRKKGQEGIREYIDGLKAQAKIETMNF